jgi:hypothetical protein
VVSTVAAIGGLGGVGTISGLGVGSVGDGDGGGVRNGDGSDGLVDDLGGVGGVSGLGDDGVESVVVIGGVVDGAGGAIGLQKAVLSLDDISVAVLALALDITGVGVVHGVVELVLRVALQRSLQLVSN